MSEAYLCKSSIEGGSVSGERGFMSIMRGMGALDKRMLEIMMW